MTTIQFRFPPPPPPPGDLQERRAREPSSNSPTGSHPRTRPSTYGDPPIVLRAREVPQVAPLPKGASHCTSPPHTGLARDHPEEQRPRKGITIKEGYTTRPPRTHQCRAKVNGMLQRGLHPLSLPKVDPPPPSVYGISDGGPTLV